jgi:hypothetical protein
MNIYLLHSSLESKRRHMAAILLAGAMCLLPVSSFADDPCVDAAREVETLLHALQRNNHLVAKDGVFQVRKIGDYGEPPTGLPSFELIYAIAGRQGFRQPISHPSTSVADVFAIQPLRTKDGARLGLAYGMGAGGRISCEYKIFQGNNGFFAKRAKW